MKSWRTLLTLTFLTIILLSNFYATVMAQALPVPKINKETFRQDTLKFAYQITTKRSPQPIKIVPFPGLAFTTEEVNLGTEEFPVYGRVIILAFPAAPNKEADAMEIIKDVTVKLIQNFISSANSEEGNKDQIIGQFIKDLYNTVMSVLIEKAGIKPAFLPYDEMSFVFVVIAWIDSKSIGEIIGNVIFSGAEKIADFAVDIVTSSVLDLLENKLKAAASNILSQVIAIGRQKITEIFEGLKSKIDSHSCDIDCAQWVCTKSVNGTCVEEKCVKFKATLSITISINQDFSDTKKISESPLKINGKISINNEGSTITRTYQLNTLLKNVISEENIGENFKSAYNEAIDKKGGSLSEELLDSFKEHASELLQSILSSYSPKIYFSKSSTFEVEASTASKACELVKESAKNWLGRLKSDVLETYDNTMSTINETIRTKIDNIIEKIRQETEQYLQKQYNTIKENLRAEAEQATGDAVNNFIQAASTSNPLLFAAYALAQGVFEAAQTMINKVRIKAVDASTQEDAESHIIILKNNNVFIDTKGQIVIEAEKDTSTTEKLYGALRGFFKGIIDSFNHKAGSMLNFIPSFCAVNIKLVKEDKDKKELMQFLAPPKPGLYVLEGGVDLVLGIDSVIEFFEKIINGVKNTYFNDQTTVFFADGGDKLLSKTLEDAKNSEKMPQGRFSNTKEYEEDGKKLLLLDAPVVLAIPYFVLPPYFIVKRVTIDREYAYLTMYAIYDLTVFARELILDEVKLLLLKAQQNIDEIKRKIREAITKVLSLVVSRIINETIKKINEALGGSATGELAYYLLEDLFLNATQNIENRIVEATAKIVGDFVSEKIDPILDKLKEYIEMGVNVIDYIEKVLAEEASIIYIPVYNSEYMEIAPYLAKVGIVGDPIDYNGQVQIKIPLSYITSIKGIDSLEALPVYRRIVINAETGEKTQSYIQVPGSIPSLEPIVAPLVPLITFDGSTLKLEFVTPVLDKKLTTETLPGERSMTDFGIDVTLIVDGKELKPLEHGKGGLIKIAPPFIFEIGKAHIITIKIYMVDSNLGLFEKETEENEKIGRFGVGIFNPASAETSIIVNPENIFTSIIKT